MGRRVASLFAVLAFMVAPALGGDRAGLDIIGYSPDGRHFAFAQFGIQDGSAFPYAEVHILDVTTDRWVPGSPIRVRVEDENEHLGAVLGEAMAQARTLLDQYRTTEPADILALNGDGVPVEDYDRLGFGLPGYALLEPRGSLSLTLETFTAKGDPACAGYSDKPILGFALSLDDNGETREVHRDVTVPLSRGCTEHYRLYGVAIPFGADISDTLPTNAVALISVYSLGFEGPDRRFLAVPLGQ